MALKIFNTLTREVEEFKPIKEGHVKIYGCGPTVYNYPHIGNIKTFLFYDLFRRYLKFKGYKVNMVVNITDVDDKTIRDSKKEGLTLKEFTEKYAKVFFDSLKTLNAEPVEHNPRATEMIDEMVQIIKDLVDRGYAYKSTDGSIYYAISKFKNYGELAHIQVDNLKAGARVSQDEYEKDTANDFALWKAWAPEDGDVFWETEIGKGRPGWHIECSAMSRKLLGKHIDIHMGGVDLIFPHHQNEVAQSEAVNGCKFVNYWVHAEHLLVDGKKMSKSLGNFYTLNDLLKKEYKPMAIRFLFLSTHFRQQMNFTWSGLEGATNSVEKMQEFYRNINDTLILSEHGDDSTVQKFSTDMLTAFEDKMDDNLNISEAIAAVFNFIRQVNTLLLEKKLSRKGAHIAKDAIDKVNTVLGVITEHKEEIPLDMMQLVFQRDAARKARDWATSDRLRKDLTDKGYIVDDTPQGTKIRKA